MTSSILIVIPTLNEARTIETVLGSLSQDLPQQAQATFVVCDGGSTDGTVGIVERIAKQRTDVHLLHNPRRIQSAAVNLAAKTFGRDADILVRCDAHAVYPTGFVRQLAESLERTGADAIVVPMDSVGTACLQNAAAWVSDTPVGSGGSAHRGGRQSGYVDHGHHAAFRMASFRRAGGYDESFTHNEDAELDCRQRALGSKLYLDADIRLEYHPRANFSGLWRQYFGYGRGRSRTARRHPGSMRARQLAVPAHLAFSVLALVIAPWFPLLMLWPLFYLLVLASTSVLLTIKHRSACALLAGPAAGVMHTAWAFGFLSGLWSVREQPWQVALAQPLWHASTMRASHD